jgi:DedD protein
VPPAAPSPKVEAKPEPKPEVKTEPKPAAKPEPKAAAKPDEKAPTSGKAQALLDGKDPAKAAAAAPRYAVQVGAFADAKKAQEVRATLEKAGFKTYAQVVTTADGKRTRVRVGPWENKAEADKTAEKIKKLSLPAAVLTL